MKVNITMDMTPQEARAFMGLPDIAPMQTRMLEEMQERMKTAFDAGDPEAMMRAWSPFFNSMGGGADAFQQFQKFFWDNARAIAAGGKRDSK